MQGSGFRIQDSGKNTSAPIPNPESRILPPFIVWLRNYLALLACLTLQWGYWFETHNIQPDLTIVPDVPGREEIHALTFGDDEFYFRVLSFMIQNSGDNFGQFSPLRYYDMHKLYYWFNLLDELDSKSNMVPSMACYYFSQTQNTEDVRYIVDYLYNHATRDVAHKWWWLLQSIYLASYRLNDMDLALKMAKPLVNKDVPVWAQQMTAVIYEKRGEMEDALRIMDTIKANAKELSDADLRYMKYFIDERIGRLEKIKKGENPPPAPMAPDISPIPAHPDITK